MLGPFLGDTNVIWSTFFGLSNLISKELKLRKGSSSSSSSSSSSALFLGHFTLPPIFCWETEHEKWLRFQLHLYKHAVKSSPQKIWLNQLTLLLKCPPKSPKKVVSKDGIWSCSLLLGTVLRSYSAFFVVESFILCLWNPFFRSGSMFKGESLTGLAPTCGVLPSGKLLR